MQLRSAAFVGSVEQSVPELGTSAGQCPKLSICMFVENNFFARGFSVDTRWRVTLGSGSRLRVEYRQAWEYMRQETMKCADYLGGMRLWSCFPCGRSWRGQL